MIYKLQQRLSQIQPRDLAFQFRNQQLHLDFKVYKQLFVILMGISIINLVQASIDKNVIEIIPILIFIVIAIMNCFLGTKSDFWFDCLLGALQFMWITINLYKYNQSKTMNPIMQLVEAYDIIYLIALQQLGVRTYVKISILIMNNIALLILFVYNNNGQYQLLFKMIIFTMYQVRNLNQIDRDKKELYKFKKHNEIIEDTLLKNIDINCIKFNCEFDLKKLVFLKANQQAQKQLGITDQSTFQSFIRDFYTQIVNQQEQVKKLEDFLHELLDLKSRRQSFQNSYQQIDINRQHVEIVIKNKINIIFGKVIVFDFKDPFCWIILDKENEQQEINDREEQLDMCYKIIGGFKKDIITNLRCAMIHFENQVARNPKIRYYLYQSYNHYLNLRTHINRNIQQPVMFSMDQLVDKVLELYQFQLYTNKIYLSLFKDCSIVIQDYQKVQQLMINLFELIIQFNNGKAILTVKDDIIESSEVVWFHTIVQANKQNEEKKKILMSYLKRLVQMLGPHNRLHVTKENHDLQITFSIFKDLSEIYVIFTPRNELS